MLIPYVSLVLTYVSKFSISTKLGKIDLLSKFLHSIPPNTYTLYIEFVKEYFGILQQLSLSNYIAHIAIPLFQLIMTPCQISRIKDHTPRQYPPASSVAMPRAPLPAMSGPFDLPPASGSQANSDSSSIPARLQSLRQVIQWERGLERRNWDEAAEQRLRQNESPTHQSPPPRPSHRRIANPRSSPHPRAVGRRSTYSSDGPPSSLGRRPRQYRRHEHPEGF